MNNDERRDFLFLIQWPSIDEIKNVTRGVAKVDGFIRTSFRAATIQQLTCFVMNNRV
jgi:hypothetical protein